MAGVDWLISRDVEYSFGQTRMIGYFCAPNRGSRSLPGVLLVHDAFGLTEDMQELARKYASLGLAVLAADVWGDRTQPHTEDEIGSLIGSMANDRDAWSGRVRAAHEVLSSQAEVNPERLAMVGYCFGGSSVLEFVREGGAIGGVVSVHGGLDLVAPEWSGQTSASVLICTGANDPMATPEMLSALQRSMSSVGIEWETDVYSNTKHAFTNPKADLGGLSDVVGYNALSAARAWATTTRFLNELFSKEK